MDIDIIGDILRQMAERNPGSAFIQSLYKQYQERGSLSKKQLEGLANKAAKSDIAPAKLATLQAIILRKHAKHRSDLPVDVHAIVPLQIEPGVIAAQKDRIHSILEKYPSHKRVLYFKNKLEKEGLSAADIKELENFSRLLL